MDEQEARRAAESDARRAAESDARPAAESDARLAAESDARLAAESDARLAAESDARLAAAFRDAAADAPPAGFDAADVVATSRRITRRRRSALAGGALAVLAVAGIGVSVIGTGGGSGPVTTVASGAAVARDAGVPDAARAAAPEAATAPVPPPGGAPANSAAAAAPLPRPPSDAVVPPLGPGTGECANRQDPALRALVEQVLPEVVGAPAAMTTQECRPGAQRGLSLEVHDGAARGRLVVSYLPPGSAVDTADGAYASEAGGGASAVPTASGGMVVVASLPDGGAGPAPFVTRLDATANALAARL